MKKSYLAAAILSVVVLTGCDQETKNTDAPVDAQQQAPKQEVNLTSEASQHAYALGASMGGFARERFKEQKTLNLETDADALMAGFEESFAGQSKYSRQELQQLMAQADNLLNASRQSVNVNEGKEYLAKNAQKDGVMVTESGLQYRVITEGTGAQPTSASDRVKVHYRGTLIDGTEFDSSFSRGQPIEFALNQVISGWTEGVQLMKEGAKYEFVIPSELAYGARGQGSIIKPYSTLIFEVELLEVIK